MIRAVDDQLVMPMTMTMISRLSRMPKSSLDPPPTTSRMIEVRMIASTNVGMTRKKSAIRISDGIGPSADEPADDADDDPEDDGDDRREQPDDHRDPGRVDGQVEHAPPELVGARAGSRGSAAPVAARSR